jgi:hypothetical protein
VVTKPTGQPRGRRAWNLRKDRDRYLIAAFWATQIHENQFKSDPRATRRAVAMLYAAIERGELSDSVVNRETINKQGGKLIFGSPTTRAQHDAGSNPIQSRADDIRRKAERAMKEDPYWIERMAAAFQAAFFGPYERLAREEAFTRCAEISEIEFFERSLVPFIEGRFDVSKATVFRLPDFMPNIVKRPGR